jgi:hypothetical protein
VVSFYLRAFGADAVKSWLECSDMPVTRWLSVNPDLGEMLIAAGVISPSADLSQAIDAEARLEQPPGCHSDDDSTVGADEHVSAVGTQSSHRHFGKQGRDKNCFFARVHDAIATWNSATQL